MESYFQKRVKAIDKVCKGKTKDAQIKWLKNELADSQTMTRMVLDSWKKTFKTWKDSNKEELVFLIIWSSLILICGIFLFTQFI